MQKTTVYLPEQLKRAVGRLARTRGISEAQLVREALQRLTEAAPPPRPRLPLCRSGKPDLADQLDRVLSGFGET